jgi:HSP20 family protein
VWSGNRFLKRVNGPKYSVPGAIITTFLIRPDGRCKMSVAEKIKQLPISREGPKLRWLEGLRRRRDVDLFDEMERMFEHMMSSSPTGWLHPARMEWPGLQAGSPKVDVIDRENDILLRAEVPGMKKEDIEVTMTDDLVTIRGSAQKEEKREEGDYYYSETSRGEFSRSVTLPAHVDGSKAKATYTDGMLELTLPKLQSAKRHKIDIGG